MIFLFLFLAYWTLAATWIILLWDPLYKRVYELDVRIADCSEVYAPSLVKVRRAHVMNWASKQHPVFLWFYVAVCIFFFVPFVVFRLANTILNATI